MFLVLLEVRAALQDLVRKAVQKLKAAVPAGQTEDIVAYLTSELGVGGDGTTQRSAPGAKSVNLWMTAESAEIVKRWARMNNHTNVMQQPSCVTATQQVSRSLQLDAEKISLSLSLSDCLWSFAEAIFEHVPAAVPTMAVATVAKIGTHQGDMKDVLPQFCHFLCSEVQDSYTTDVSRAAMFLGVHATCCSCS